MTLSGAIIPCCVSERFTALCSLTVLRSWYKNKYRRDVCVSKTSSPWLLKLVQGWAFCQRKDCKSGSVFLGWGQNFPRSLLLSTCLSLEGGGDSPTWHVKVETVLLADINTNVRGRSFYGICNQASGSSCLRLVILCAAPTAVQWQSKGNFSAWQTWQGDGGRNAPGEASTWVEWLREPQIVQEREIQG